MMSTVSLEIRLEYALLFNTLEIVDFENPVFRAIVSNVVFMAHVVVLLRKCSESFAKNNAKSFVFSFHIRFNSILLNNFTLGSHDPDNTNTT